MFLRQVSPKLQAVIGYRRDRDRVGLAVPQQQKSLVARFVEAVSVDLKPHIKFERVGILPTIAGTDKCDRAEIQRVTEDHNHDHDDAVDLDEETAEALREIAQSDLSVAECAAAILRANE